MAKRYLGGGVSFEQKDVYQEFSEEGSGGSSTLSGLTDVHISNPADGQLLIYNAESGKWENGEGGSGGGGVHSVGAQTVEGETALTVTAGQLFGWLQNGEYVVLHVNQSEGVAIFKAISEYEFTAENGYGFNFGGNWYVANNADDYPVGAA